MISRLELVNFCGVNLVLEELGQLNIITGKAGAPLDALQWALELTLYEKCSAHYSAWCSAGTSTWSGGIIRATYADKVRQEEYPQKWTATTVSLMRRTSCLRDEARIAELREFVGLRDQVCVDPFTRVHTDLRNKVAESLGREIKYKGKQLFVITSCLETINALTQCSGVDWPNHNTAAYQVDSSGGVYRLSGRMLSQLIDCSGYDLRRS